MTIQVTMFDTNTLLGVMREVEPATTYFLDLAFGQTVTSDNEYIDFEKLSDGRKLAPLVVPLAQGVPMFDQQTKVTRLKPAYLKPKDAVTAARTLRKNPSALLGQTNTSPAARYNAIIGDIMQAHRNGIERRWEWMAAQALLTGAITLVGPDYPEVVVNFGRESNHSVDLTSGVTWDDPDADILGDIQVWVDRVAQAKFGGIVNRITFGPAAWSAFSKNAGVKAQLDTQVRGTGADFVTGISSGAYVKRMGQINGIELYVYNDYYEVNGSPVPFMSTNDVLLTSPSINGIRAFGAILDSDAQLKPLAVFPKMWKQEDPSVTYVMSQSAPLMVPINPNASLRATVLSS